MWDLKPVQTLYQTPGGPIAAWTVKKIYALFALGYPLVSFCLFTYDNYLFVSIYVFDYLARNTISLHI